MNRRPYILLAVALVIAMSRPATAQEKSAPSDLPDAPAPKQAPNDTTQKQDKNIFATPLGLITRRSYVYPELATTPGTANLQGEI